MCACHAFGFAWQRHYIRNGNAFSPWHIKPSQYIRAAASVHVGPLPKGALHDICVTNVTQNIGSADENDGLSAGMPNKTHLDYLGWAQSAGIAARNLRETCSALQGAVALLSPLDDGSWVHSICRLEHGGAQCTRAILSEGAATYQLSGLKRGLC